MHQVDILVYNIKEKKSNNKCTICGKEDWVFNSPNNKFNYKCDQKCPRPLTYKTSFKFINLLLLLIFFLLGVSCFWLEWCRMGADCRMGSILEGKTAIADHYEITSSTGASSGKNMHRQV